MNQWVLVVGATSGIGRATAEALAARGYALYLTGRNQDELARNATDLRLRFNVETAFASFDVEHTKHHAHFLAEVLKITGGIKGVVMTVGLLGDQESARRTPRLEQIFHVNLVGPASFLAHCADELESKKGGFIVGISSVAGDRGRQSNYVYGAAKGGFTRYLQGLRNRLHASGITVLEVRPGFVDTPMTFGLPGLFLVASPEYVGERIARALDARRDVVYVPWFWRYIMFAVRSMPECIFKRLTL